jgi:CheY-like chemotaxis protein/DNA-directed RNA polymerase specialized sigma24 family protein
MLADTQPALGKKNGRLGVMQEHSTRLAAKHIAAVANHVPQLRQYGTALLGSQARADAYISICLEDIAAEPDAIAEDSDPKVELFKLFHVVLGMLRLGEEDESQDLQEALNIRDHSGAMAPVSRRLLLLVYGEEFDIEDAAKILGISTELAGELLEDAQCDMHCAAGARILIIEDEEMIAEVIKETIEDMGHSVVGVAHSEEGAIELAEKEKPDLVLADVWLRGRKSGIKAVEQIRSMTGAQVIFVTGYPDALVEELNVTGSCILTKPFSPAMLERKITNMLPWQPLAH